MMYVNSYVKTKNPAFQQDFFLLVFIEIVDL